MKKMSQTPDNNMLYLATDRIMFHVREPYRIQEEMIEMKNFVPEAFMIYQFQEYRDLELECYDCIRVAKRNVPVSVQNSQPNQPESFMVSDGDGDDEDWDDDDEDWDDEDDEDWDEDDEEDWDDEDEEDWDDEDDEDFDDDLDDDEAEE